MKHFNKLFLSVTAIICLLPAAVLNAQDTLTVSLSKALEIALSESPTIKVADKEIQRVNYSKKERVGGLLPTVSVSGAYQRAIKKQKMFFSIPGFPSNPDGIEVGQDNTFTGGISASLPIIAPSLWATINMSELELELAQESARSSKISLYNQVTKAYYAILLSQDSYNVIKRSYENSKENSRIIYNKYKQGSVSEFEWIRADVQERNALTSVVSTENAVNLSKLQLKMLMGIDMYTEIAVEGRLSDFEANMYSDVLKIDTTTLNKNSDLKQFDIQKKQLEQTEKIHKASLLPTLGASLNYQYMSMVNDSATFTNQHVWFPTSTFGLQLSIPLFQGGTKYNKSKQIKIQREEMELQRDNLKRSLELQTITQMNNIKNALKKIESNKEGLRQAEKGLSISQKMYEVGMATFLDLNNADLNYKNAGLSYNQSIYDFLSAKADLEKLLGQEIAY
ncbi:MAG: TolC family protein [Bacteroidales bacterium]|nr:TolC family protein [Bacteroidales bacterium]